MRLGVCEACMSELCAHMSARGLVSWGWTLPGSAGCCGVNAPCRASRRTAVVTKNCFPSCSSLQALLSWWRRWHPSTAGQQCALPHAQGLGLTRLPPLLVSLSATDVGTAQNGAGRMLGTPCGCAPLDGKLRPACSLHLCPGGVRAAGDPEAGCSAPAALAFQLGTSGCTGRGQ